MASGLGGRKQNNERRYPGKGGCNHNPVRIDERRAEAKERAEAWSKLTTQQKLAALDRRLGKDVGAKKQRAKIVAPVNKVVQVEQTKTTLESIERVKNQKAKDRRDQNRKARGEAE